MNEPVEPRLKAACAVEALSLLEAEARERMQAGGGDKKSGRAKLPHPIQGKGQSRDKAAKLFRVGGRYISDAKAIKVKAPETFGAIKQKSLAELPSSD